MLLSAFTLFGVASRHLSKEEFGVLTVAALQLDVISAAIKHFQLASKIDPSEGMKSAFAALPEGIDPNIALLAVSQVDMGLGSLQMTARSFVNELALFRLMLKKIGSINKKITQDVDDIIVKFDAKVPGVKEIRDTFAHYDERMFGLARGKKISIPTDDPEPDLAFGWRIEKEGRIATRAASGKLVEMEISEVAILACFEALASTLELFEKN